jgi:hypothetical protein
MKNTEKMKYWLMRSDYTPSELAAEIGCDQAHCWKWIQRQLKQGNVECVATRKRFSAQRAYTWCGDDDVTILAIKAAEYLRDQVATDEAKALARKIFLAYENTDAVAA